MRKLLCTVPVGLLVLGLAVQPAPAITGGAVDEQNRYPNVGTILVINPPTDNPNVEVPRILCSGTLIHPRVRRPNSE